MVSDALLYAGIVGFFLPMLLALLNRQNYAADTKAVLAFVAVIFVSLGTAYFSGQLVGLEPIRMFLIVLAASVVSYKSLNPMRVIPYLESKGLK